MAHAAGNAETQSERKPNSRNFYKIIPIPLDFFSYPRGRRRSAVENRSAVRCATVYGNRASHHPLSNCSTVLFTACRWIRACAAREWRHNTETTVAVHAGTVVLQVLTAMSMLHSWIGCIESGKSELAPCLLLAASSILAAQELMPASGPGGAVRLFTLRRRHSGSAGDTQRPALHGHASKAATRIRFEIPLRATK